MADQDHFEETNINGTSVSVPLKPILGMKIYGATPGQALVVDPGGFIKGGSTPAPTTFASLIGSASVANPSTSSAPNYPQSDQLSLTRSTTGPGKNLGDYAWNVEHGLFINQTTYTRGIKQGIGCEIQSRATGDSAAAYLYNTSDSGVLEPADEGQYALGLASDESVGYFHGTVAATAGTGDTAPTFAFTNGNNWLTDGGFILNVSKGALSGTLNGTSSQFASTICQQCPVTGVTLPLTTAWGTFAATLPYNTTTADIGTPATVPVTLGAIGGTTRAFVVGQTVWIAGNQRIEQSVITSAGSVSGGVQNVGFKARYPNSGGTIFAGPLVGQYISLDANLAFSGIRSSYPALGTLDGVNLIYVAYVAGGGNRQIASANGNEAALSTVGSGRGGFHLFPGAELTANYGNLSPTLEPNSVAWAVGDVVEAPHPFFFGGSVLRVERNQSSPGDPNGFGAAAISIEMQGTGISSASTFFPIRNSAPNTNFQLYGGPLKPPLCIAIAGHFQNGMTWTRPPVGPMLDCLGVDTQQTTYAWLGHQGGARVQMNTAANRVEINGDILVGGITQIGYQLKMSGTPGPLVLDPTGVVSGVAGFTGTFAVGASGGSTAHVTNGIITSVTTP